MLTGAIHGGLYEMQGAARPAPPIPGLDQGNPAQSNRPAPSTPQAPQADPGQAAAPAVVGTPLTSQQIRDQIRNDIRNGVRSGGNPTINIPSDFNLRNAVPQGAVDISIAMFITMAFIIVGLPLARAFGRRMDAQNQHRLSGASHIGPQLEQLQQSVDAMSIELERITESQRFQSKLMAGRNEKVEEPAKLVR